MRFARSLISCFAIAAGLAAVAPAAAPIGTASSGAGFQLNGVYMRSDGVGSWPVMPGDEIRSGTSSVVIRFNDGSRMTLGEQSQIKLVDSGAGVNVDVASGQLQFNLVAKSAVKVSNQGRAVGTQSGVVTSLRSQPANQPGSLQVESRRVPPPPLSSP